MSLGSDPIFQKIIDGLKGNEAKAKAVNGVFLYKITKDGKVAKEWSKYHWGQKTTTQNVIIRHKSARIHFINSGGQRAFSFQQ